MKKPQERTLEEAVKSVGITLACPACSGQTVADSSSPTAKQIQSDIRCKLKAGESPRHIQNTLATQWWEKILLAPQDLWLWWCPYVGAGFIIMALIWVWRKHKRKSY